MPVGYKQRSTPLPALEVCDHPFLPPGAAPYLDPPHTCNDALISAAWFFFSHG